jgi:hypothetical protein
VITPLRKRKSNGELYSRLAPTEESLNTLKNLPIEEVVRRGRINDQKTQASYLLSASYILSGNPNHTATLNHTVICSAFSGSV